MFDRLRALSIRQQLLLVALVIAVTGGSLGSVWFFFLRTTYRPLFNDLRPVDAATIVADLERKKIPYELANGGTAILVPTERADATRIYVMSSDLPLKGTVGFELFNKSDMGITDFAQKINYQRALQGELERTIMTLDGVESARVHLSMGEDRIFRDDHVAPKASVTVRMQRGISLSAAGAQGIARLVAAAVPDLDAANVVILNEQGDLIGTTTRDDAEIAPPFAQERVAVEQYYRARIREVLAGAYARARIDVVVPASVGPEVVGAPPGTTLADWTPAARQFPLEVTISNPVPFDAGSEETLRALIASVIGTNASKSDAIAFAVASTPAPMPSMKRSMSLQKPTRGWVPVETPREPAMPVSAVGVAAFTLLALSGVYLMILHIRRPRRLTAKARAHFGERLRAALEGNGNAAIHP